MLFKASQLFLQIINLLQIQISCDGRCLQLNSFAMLSLCQHAGTWQEAGCCPQAPTLRELPQLVQPQDQVQQALFDIDVDSSGPSQVSLQPPL